MSNTLQKLPPFNLHTTQVTSSLKKKEILTVNRHTNLLNTNALSKCRSTKPNVKQPRTREASLLASDRQTYILTDKEGYWNSMSSISSTNIEVCPLILALANKRLI